MTESSVFISYSRRDTEVVIPLVQIVRAAGGGVFRDAESIPPGARWRAVIAGAISGCDTFLLFWCAHSSTSAEVKSECNQAIDLGKPIVPILLDHTPLAGQLAEFHGIDMRGVLGDHREEEITKEVPIPGLNGPAGSRKVRERVLIRPEPIQYLKGGLQLWERLGSAIDGEPKPASGRYDFEKVSRILSNPTNFI
jgi:hypothetical protein